MAEQMRPHFLLQGQHAVFILKDGTQLTAGLRLSPRARRARLVLTAGGQLRLTLPSHALPLAETFVSNMLSWLEKTYRRRFPEPQHPALPAAVDIPLLPAKFAVRHAGTADEGRRAASLAPCGRLTGAPPLLLSDGARRPALLEREHELLLYADMTEEGLRAAARLLRRWGRHAADALLPPLLLRLAGDMGVSVESVRCRDQRTLWGCCRRLPAQPADGGRNRARISLNWRAVLLPAELARHLCLHELCHAAHKGHSPAYRAALEACSPGSRAKERALADAWRTLPWWARHDDAH